MTQSLPGDSARHRRSKPRFEAEISNFPGVVINKIIQYLTRFIAVSFPASLSLALLRWAQGGARRKEAEGIKNPRRRVSASRLP